MRIHDIKSQIFARATPISNSRSKTTGQLLRTLNFPPKLLHHLSSSNRQALAYTQTDSKPMTRLSTARFIEAEEEVRTAARVFRPNHSTRATPLPVQAFSAVLETNELLHQILSNVPIEYRDGMWRDSKAWNSTLLKLGCHHDPTAIYLDWVYDYEPAYVTDIGIRYDPMVFAPLEPLPPDSPSAEYVYPRNGPQNIRFAERRDRTQILQRHREFITSPPITRARVSMLIDNFLFGAAIMKVSDGIRIGPLIEVLDKMGVHRLPISVLKIFYGNVTARVLDAVERPHAAFLTCRSHYWDSENLTRRSLAPISNPLYRAPRRFADNGYSDDESDDEDSESEDGYGGDEFYGDIEPAEVQTWAKRKPKMSSLLGL